MMADGSEVSRKVASSLKLDQQVVARLVSLLDDENTIPFIARYRQENTGGLDPVALRRIQSEVQRMRGVENRTEKVKKALGSKMTQEVERALHHANTIAEVEEVYAPFKKAKVCTLAERARQAGLEQPAQMLLRYPTCVLWPTWVKEGTEGRGSIEQVKRGVQHIVAEMIAKSATVKDLRSQFFPGHPSVPALMIETTFARSAPDGARKDQKYKFYNKLRISACKLAPHQVLAINRGEENKILTVKVTVQEYKKRVFLQELRRRWIPRHLPKSAEPSWTVLECAIQDALTRLILPKICRDARRCLTKKAQDEAIKIFSENVSQLLLTPPVKGKVVLGMDPGFNQGCKLALLSENGDVLETAIIYPVGAGSSLAGAQAKIKELLLKHRCETIAIGNGVGCRETEWFVSNMIKWRIFAPLDVVYCIVNEDGASVYSASTEAQAELPGLHVSLRGAVSIGRRLQNPLAELIKVEPKHLGVGMYQHDLSDAQLRRALDGVLEDCVCSVGVDPNVAGVRILSRIAGLSVKKAEAIVEWRKRNGRFLNREQLKQVKGIGPKTYQQCAGFLRISNESPREDHAHSEGPSKVAKSGPNPTRILRSRSANAESDDVFITSTNKPKPDVIVILSDTDDEGASPSTGRKRKTADESVANSGKRKKRKHHNQNGEATRVEPLDRTWIHPESYCIANQFMETIGVTPAAIGHPSMKENIDSAMRDLDVPQLAQTLDVGVPTLEHIISGLRQPTAYDIRASFAEPLFKRHVRSIDDVICGMELSGRVTNVVTFGAFVDCGCHIDGLIPVRAIKHIRGGVRVGDMITGLVTDVSRKRLTLSLRSVRSRLE